jgi:hypothetical protein
MPYLQFRKYVLNIIDWGKDERPKENQVSLDSLIKEGKRKSADPEYWLQLL